jgi:hypothetical protein
MKAEKLLLELEQTVLSLGYRLRKETGDFKGSSCVVKGEKLVILNKKSTPESQNAVLGRLLYETDLENVFMSPALKKELWQMWQKYPDFEDKHTLFGDLV